MGKREYQYSLIVFIFVFAFVLASCSPKIELENENVEIKKILCEKGEDPSFDNGIIGGSKINKSNILAKHVVLIAAAKINPQTRKVEKMSTCTGTLVSQDTIITAAHCVVNEIKEKQFSYYDMVKVVLSNDVNCSEDTKIESVSSKELIAHPKWNHTPQNDLALIKLEKDLESSQYQKMDVVGNVNILANRDKLYIAGYGSEKNQEDDAKMRLKYAQLPVLETIDSAIFLDQSSGTGACFGDSGGPAFIKLNNRLQILGVGSQVFGKEKSRSCDGMAIYTSLSGNRTWLVNSFKVLNGVRDDVKNPFEAK